MRIFSRALRVKRGSVSEAGSRSSRSSPSSRYRRAASIILRREGKGLSMKRRRIFERDAFRCVYCGEQFPTEELTVDHVEPHVRGGDRSDGNLVTACKGWNTLKGHRRLSDFL